MGVSSKIQDERSSCPMISTSVVLLRDAHELACGFYLVGNFLMHSWNVNKANVSHAQQFI